jgi:hypothetical protein
MGDLDAASLALSAVLVGEDQLLAFGERRRELA